MDKRTLRNGITRLQFAGVPEMTRRPGELTEVVRTKLEPRPMFAGLGE
jgi:hypothetical protein